MTFQEGDSRCLSESCDSHIWEYEYYGYVCSRCHFFYVYGCAPWEDFEDLPYENLINFFQE